MESIPSTRREKGGTRWETERAEAPLTGRRAHSTHRASVGAISQMGKPRPGTGQGDAEPQQAGLVLGWRLARALQRASLCLWCRGASLSPAPPLTSERLWVISAARMPATPRFSFPAPVTQAACRAALAGPGSREEAVGADRKPRQPAPTSSLGPGFTLSARPVPSPSLPGLSGDTPWGQWLGERLPHSVHFGVCQQALRSHFPAYSLIFKFLDRPAPHCLHL